MILDKKSLWHEHSNKILTFLIAITISCFIYQSYSTISDENQGNVVVLRDKDRPDKFTEFLKSQSTIYNLNGNANAIINANCDKQRDYKDTASQFKKENFILGIFSKPTEQNLRNAQRNTWLKTPKNLFNYKYIILDHEKTEENVAESDLYEDILFLKIPVKNKLNKLLGDNNNNSALKLKYWFKWVFENEIYDTQNAQNSKIKLIGKADSDTFICSEQIFQELSKYNDENLFYTWTKNGYKIGKTYRRVDEMFMAFGLKIAEQFADLDFCRNRTKLPQNSSEEQKEKHKILLSTPCLRTTPLRKFELRDNYHANGIILSDLYLWKEDLQEKIYNKTNAQIKTVNESERMVQHIEDKVPDICNSYRGYEETPIRRMINLNSELKKLNSKSSGGSATSGALFEGPKIISYNHTNLPILKAPNLPKHENCKNFAVVTTIFKATIAVNNIIKSKSNFNWCLIIVTDLKTPKTLEDYGLEFTSEDEKNRVIYLGVQLQMYYYPKLSSSIPWNHFGRKNLGYIYAIDAGAEKIWDFDDDNDGMVDEDEILENLVGFCGQKHGQKEKEPPLNINPYMYFGVNETISWPRGFPLDYILDENSYNFPSLCDFSEELDHEVSIQKSKENIAVIQSLANNQPDVDGMYRLTRKTPFDFLYKPSDKSKKNLLIPRGSFTPFNAQATLWRDGNLDTFAMLLLPTTVHGRVADIWRSYFTQYIFKHTSKSLVFSKPYIIQDRNVHNYLADFNSEHPLYFKSSALAKILDEKEYDHKKSVKDNLIELYIDMYERGFVEIEDVELVKVWLEHIYVYRR